MKLAKDTVISHYKILSEIGKGGMGEVYLAQDTKLNRQVAIKFLSDEFSKDADKLNRFVQEAQAASALNHPNILTIHEIGEIDGTNYIATEFIKGETLNEYLKGKDIKFGSVLDIAIQIASALDEAHSAGIVHRDIKPDNVMVRENGLAKILDFGIAKLTEKQTPEVESEDATAIHVNTIPGMIIGTANYMSPEQAKGKEVDARTDIFSFGVVLYEMIAGHLPFEGETPMEIIAAIINKEPKPLNSQEVPSEIERIITKALRKDRNERYQTIKGLLADLKEVKLDLDVQDKLEKTVQPIKGDHANTQMLKATTIEEQQATSITEGGRNRLPLIAVAGVLAALLIFAGWYFLAGDLFSEELPFAKIKVEEITSAPEIRSPVFSPDGKFIAYARAALELYVEKKSLILRQTGSGAENVIFEVPEGLIELITFSSDGEFIYFIRESRGDQRGLYKISTLGGSPKKILDGNIPNAYISPDGKKISYVKRDDSNQEVFHLADIDGSNSVEMLKLEDIDATNMDLGPWHPDGTKLLIEIYKNIDSKRMQGSLATLDMNKTDLRPKERLNVFYDEDMVNFFGASWMPDGNGLMFLIWQRQGPDRQVRYLSYPEGKIRQITDDFNDYQNIKLSADGKSMIGTTRSYRASIWSVDPETKKGRQVITHNNNFNPVSISSTQDGKMYYLKGVKNGSAIYSNDQEGGAEKELFTTPERIHQFKTDKDGKFIVASIYSGKLPSADLVRFDIDGSNKTQLTNKEYAYDRDPQITKEGYVLFVRSYFASDKPTAIMQVPMAGGEAERIDLGPTDGDADPSLSPDGKYLAYEQSIEDKSSGKSKKSIRVVEFHDGKAGKLVLEKEIVVPRIRWTPESDAIIFEKPEEGSNLFQLSLSGQTETQITDFNLKEDSADFTWSPDGKRILAFRGTASANLVLIKDVATDGK